MTQISHLRLDGVECAQVSVQRLEGLVAQRTDRQRLQVQQLSGRRVLLWQDELPAGTK
jgi:hypothetical protein